MIKMADKTKMVKNKLWIGITVLALISTLSFIGYNITNQTYFCESRGIVMECARFSESELRCYPNLINRIGYRDCQEGWKHINNFIELNETYSEKIKLKANNKNWECEVLNGMVNSYTKCLSNKGTESYIGELL